MACCSLEISQTWRRAATSAFLGTLSWTILAASSRRSATALRASHRVGAQIDVKAQWAEADAKSAARQGEVDKTEYAIKRYCPMKLGKRELPPELDLLGKIMGADPGLPERLGLTQEKMAFRFTTIRDLLIEQLGCSEMAAGLCVALAANGKEFQNAGKPVIPAPRRVMGALSWLEKYTNANRQDGSLRAVVEKYPFLIAKSLDAFKENFELCPENIDYNSAVVFRPDRVDKVFQCGGTCKGRCGSCWFG